MRPGERFGVRMTTGQESGAAARNEAASGQLRPLLLAIALGIVAGWLLAPLL